MNKKIMLGLAIGIVIVLLIFILFINAFSTNAAFMAQPTDTLTIGAALALTGKAASYGMGTKNGMELALEELKINDKPLKINVVYDDTTSSQEKAVSSMQKLIEVDGAKTIIMVSSDEVLANAKIANLKKVILASPVAGSDDVDKAGKYVFRNREPAKQSSYALANYLVEKEITATAIFAAKASSSIPSYKNSFVEKYSSLWGKVAFEFYYDEAMPDVRNAIVKAKQENIEAGYIIASKDKDGAEVIKQLRELGFDGIILGGPALETTKFFEILGSGAEGVIIASPEIDYNAPNASALLKKYKEKFGEEMPFYAANAFDLINMLNDAALKCDVNTDCIMKYVRSIKNYPGLGGNTTFNPDGSVTKQSIIKIAKNGKFVSIDSQ